MSELDCAQRQDRLRERLWATSRWVGALVVFAIAGCAAMATRPSLADLQGGWWESCDDPAVAIYIDGDEYSGDFLGNHRLTLSGDELVFTQGLLAGHDIEVTHQPLSMRILRVSSQELVLRRATEANHGLPDWHLVRCDPATGLPMGSSPRKR